MKAIRIAFLTGLFLKNFICMAADTPPTDTPPEVLLEDCLEVAGSGGTKESAQANCEAVSREHSSCAQVFKIDCELKGGEYGSQDQGCEESLCAMIDQYTWRCKKSSLHWCTLPAVK